MEYYHCSYEQLLQEVRRRGYTPTGTADQLSEALEEDDATRGTAATTLTTQPMGYLVPQLLDVPPHAELEQFARAGSLINQQIVYWTLGTFFPSLQLFFKSGLSCTIDAGRVADAHVGLDEALRFRLQDCSHEEDGRVVKTTLPERFARAGAELMVQEAVIARRTSMAVAVASELSECPRDSAVATPLGVPSSGSAALQAESHVVLGIRIEGMSSMGYVWARIGAQRQSRRQRRHAAAWTGVQLSGLRNDVPVPFLGDPGHALKPGTSEMIVCKQSLITGDVRSGGTSWPLETRSCGFGPTWDRRL